MRNHRRGMMMMELIAVCVLLGMLLAVCMQMVAAVASQHRAAERRQCAMLELGNIMERVAARPWNQLTAAALASERPAASAVDLLPEAELKMEVAALPNEPNAKRITAVLRWRDRDGCPPSQTILTTYRYNLD